MDDSEFVELVIAIGETQLIHTKLLASINVKLGKLVNQKTESKKKANEILKVLKAEEELYSGATRLEENPTKEEKLPKTGKYQWYPIVGGGKVRPCDSIGCTYYLKFNEDTRKYQHGKYDANTQVWSYTHDLCDYWEGS